MCVAYRSDEVGRCETAGCTPLTRVITLLCVGLLFCILGVVSYTTFAPILEQQVKANLVIDPSNEVYENWKEPPVEILAKMYLFNYTNPEEILAGAKPRLEQVGPFVYKERRLKVNITFNDNGTVSYVQTVWYEYAPELSGASLDVELYTLNLPMISTAYRNRKNSPSEEELMAFSVKTMFALQGQTIFVHKKARELLFEGYEDSLMEMGYNLGWAPSPRFGWQIGRNNSNDGIWTIFTGANGMDNYGTVDNWEGRQRVTGFRKTCSYVNGTSGEMWPPYTLTAETPITFFVSHLCRSLRLDFLRNEMVKGIRVLRYHISPKLFDYSIEDNQCFCSKKKNQNAECLPNGLLDLNRCHVDAPLAVSLPHQLYVDPSISNTVEGLSPDPDLHEFFMDVEPTMGVPVRVSARFQMNVIVDAFKYFDDFEIFKQRTFWPTFWIETGTTVSDDVAFKIRLVTEDLSSYVTLAAFAWVLLGLVVILFTLGYVITNARRSKQDRPATSDYTAVKMIATSTADSATNSAAC